MPLPTNEWWMNLDVPRLTGRVREADASEAKVIVVGFAECLRRQPAENADTNVDMLLSFVEAARGVGDDLARMFLRIAIAARPDSPELRAFLLHLLVEQSSGYDEAAQVWQDLNRDIPKAARRQSWDYWVAGALFAVVVSTTTLRRSPLTRV